MQSLWHHLSTQSAYWLAFESALLTGRQWKLGGYVRSGDEPRPNVSRDFNTGGKAAGKVVLTRRCKYLLPNALLRAAANGCVTRVCQEKHQVLRMYFDLFGFDHEPSEP